MKFILGKRSLHNRYRINKKIQYSMFITLIIAITCIGANINRNLVKQKNVEESIVKKNAMTPTSSIKSEEQQHNYSFKAMKNEQEEINYVKGNGKFAYKYCFYDIDKNGIDELIVQGDLFVN